MPTIRTVPERSPGAQIVTVCVSLFVGPYLGLQLGTRLAPDSAIAQSASVVAFAAIFLAGSLLWMGLGIGAVVVSALVVVDSAGTAWTSATSQFSAVTMRTSPLIETKSEWI